MERRGPRGYPYVTAKCAVSLDGRVAGAEGRRVQLTGSVANVYAHALRARVGAIVVGSGTVLSDDPQLTVRHVPLSRRAPVRVVVGNREIPADRKILDATAPTKIMRGHEPRDTLDGLFDDGGAMCSRIGSEGARGFPAGGSRGRTRSARCRTWLGSGPRALPGVDRLDSKVEIMETQALGRMCSCARPFPERWPDVHWNHRGRRQRARHRRSRRIDAAPH